MQGCRCRIVGAVACLIAPDPRARSTHGRSLPPAQLFGYKLDSCNTVPGSQQLCPPGETFEMCPSHFDCYLRCNETVALTWYSVPASPYGGMAYCEAFPRQQYDAYLGNAANASGLTGVEYWAQVGKASTFQPNYGEPCSSTPGEGDGVAGGPAGRDCIRFLLPFHARVASS